jgi:hypothetical protein
VIRLVEEIAKLARQEEAEAATHPVNAPAPVRLSRELAVFESADREAAKKPKEIVKEALSEYFLYSVEGRDTIPNGWSKRLPSFRAQDVPLTSMDPNNLPAFSFVTPNLCNDTHDCDVATGDAWLQSFIPKITASADYQAGKTVVFLTWDEDDGSASNHVATIVLSAYTPPGTRAGTSFSHYSLLRTTEELLGATTFLGGAATANDMRSSFHL